MHTGDRFPSDDAVAVVVDLARDGDPDALQDLCQLCRPVLTATVEGFARRARADGVDMEDLHQEAAEDLLELARGFDPTRGPAFGAYLRSNLRWRLANYLRAEERRMGPFEKGVGVEVLDEIAAPQPAPPLANPKLARALRHLSPRQRMVVAGIYWQERSVADVAHELGVTRQSVTALRRRAEKVLRDEMAGRDSP